MIVVADTSPLNYLIQIGYESVLPALYKRVLLPPAVLAELHDPSAPAAVRQWLLHVPEWIEAKTTLSEPAVELISLDPGEREAIQLAIEQGADLLLIDERRGRLEAIRRGLATTGTLGVLLVSAQRGLVNAETSYYRLVNETNFRSTPALQENFLRRAREIVKKNI